MAFIQIIEVRTKSSDELKALGDEFFGATEGKRTVPDTAPLAETQMALLDGPPGISDLDIIEDRT